MIFIKQIAYTRILQKKKNTQHLIKKRICNKLK